MNELFCFCNVYSYIHIIIHTHSICNSKYVCKVIVGNSRHAQTSDSYIYFVLVLNKEQHYNYSSSIVTSYTHMLENEHDTKSMQYIIIHKYAIHTNK